MKMNEPRKKNYFFFLKKKLMVPTIRKYKQIFILRSLYWSVFLLGRKYGI